MTRSSRHAAAVLLLALSTLAACGGGGDDAATADTPSEAAAPPPPSSDQTACFPDMATYDALVLRMTPEEAVKRIGCPGYEPPPQASTAGQKILQWIDARSDARAIELVFDPAVGLIRRSGYFTADDQQKSACVPTQAVFDQVVKGADYPTVAQLFGCEGELRVDLLSATGPQQREKRYAWGHYGHQTLPSAFVIFTNGLVREKASTRLK